MAEPECNHEWLPVKENSALRQCVHCLVIRYDVTPLYQPPQGAELELLREYVHLLEEALCMWRWPLKYADRDQSGKLEATCVAAEDSMLRRAGRKL